MNKRRKFFCFFGLLLVFIMMITTRGRGEPLLPYEGTSPKPGTKPPVITHAFAVEKGRYGYIWKIYLNAEDPDNDMLKIASVVDQVGYGHYPTDWIYLKAEYQKHFKGYIQWNTFSSRASHIPEWTQITLKVSIIDKARNESNVVVFPFTFQTGVKDEYQYKQPSPFDQGSLPRLGYVDIDLRNPLDDNDGHGLRREW